MQITPITSQYLAREYRRTQRRITPHLHCLQTEAPAWTTSPSAVLQRGFNTSGEQNCSSSSQTESD